MVFMGQIGKSGVFRTQLSRRENPVTIYLLNHLKAPWRRTLKEIFN